MAEPKTDKQAISLEAAMAGILILLADEREARIADDPDAPRTEVILHRAGLSIGQVATVLGKKYETAKSAIRRGQSR